jgi:redox-sensitive bicupin YhaK (pirin superfamily)
MPYNKEPAMSKQRRIARIVTVPPLAPGFIGPGHLAAPVVSPDEFALNDPFIMLADDHVDIGDRPVGGPHPHAGFETVTLVLEGAIEDRDEGGVIQAGEVQWMTAGRGIIHSENVRARGRVRILQLWLTLPKAERWTTPAFQDLHAGAIPVRRESGAEVRIYSGASGGLQAPTRNHVPVTMVEITMNPGVAVEQELPASYNGFAYVISGTIQIGDPAAPAQTGQVAWLDRAAGDGTTVLRIAAGHEGARVVLYAGQPQGDPIVSYGPFIGDSQDDIRRLYDEYRGGRFERMSELARAAAAQ